MVNLVNISGGYSKGQAILKNINLHIEKGKCLAVIGQNGAGKSSLAKSIINTLPYREGKVIFNGMDISNDSAPDIIKKGIGFFSQGGQIFPNLTILENLQFAGHSLTKDKRNASIKEMQEIFVFLHNTDNLRKKAGSLSGGERHILALAMVMVNNPKFIILDEISAGLSPINTAHIYEILYNLRNKYALSMLLIEHNVKRAVEFADDAILIKNGVIKNIINGINSKNDNMINNIIFQ